MSAADRPAADRTTVIGGGIAGLVAARRLALGGRAVTVLEASNRWGGQVARHTVAGIELDAAAESFATRGGIVAGLAAELGLGDDIVPPAPLPAWLFRADGSAVPLPATGVLGIPANPWAPDVVAAIGRRAAFRASLDAVLPGGVGAGSGSVGDLVRRRMGAGVLEGLVAPVVRGIHSTTPDELTLERAHPGLSTGLRRHGSLARAVRDLRAAAPAGSQVAGIRGGVACLVDALVAELERLGADMRLGAHGEVMTPDEVSVGNSSLHGSVVVAAPGVGSARTPGRRVAVATLLVDAPQLDDAPRGTGVLVSAGAPVRARALTHATAKWPWLAERTDGLHVVRLSYDEASVELARVRQEAEILLGVSVQALVGGSIETWERAAPRTHAVDGMHFVGESGGGTGLASVVDQAESVARHLLGVDSQAPG